MAPSAAPSQLPRLPKATRTVMSAPSCTPLTCAPWATGPAAAARARRRTEGRRDAAARVCTRGTKRAAARLATAENQPAGARPPRAADPADDHGLEAEDQPRRTLRGIEIGAHRKEHASNRDHRQ